MNIEDYDFTWVLRPIYVLFTTEGQISELFCKGCGTRIAGMVDRTVEQLQQEDGTRIEIRNRLFTRTEDYVEAKFEFWDGSFHVTNGCKRCLHKGLTTDQMYEMHIADLLTDGGKYIELAKVRVPRRIVVVRKDGGGIE